MAYFRCGGGGMPAGLQSGMDAVLNKKFGTSTTYPASGWPDNVNLLGPLPIIISNKAPIVSFNDGADDVPISEGTFYIAPSQSGTGTPSPSNPRPIVAYTGMTIQQTGKNLLDVSTATGTGIIWFYYDNGILLKKGVTYTLSCKNYGVGSISFYGTDHTTQLAYASISTSSAKVSYTPSEDVYACPRIYQSGLTPSGLIDVQFEVGSTATTYEAYKAKTPIVDAFGRTIYGGELNITTGVLTATHVYKTFTGADSENWQAGTTGTYRRTWLSRTLQSTSAYTSILCDIIPVSADSENVDRGMSCRSTNYESDRFYVFTPISDTTITDVATWKSWLSNNNLSICYEVTTPVTYQLDPHELRTYYGANNFYCDTGDSQLNYRADISLYINNH